MTLTNAAHAVSNTVFQYNSFPALSTKMTNERQTRKIEWQARKSSRLANKVVGRKLRRSNAPSRWKISHEKFWRFDLPNHFKISHTEEIIPGVAVIPEAEKSLLQKKFRKNALKKQDLERLNDSEFLLLPLTDFWDSKKKNWKTKSMRISGSETATAWRIFLEKKKFK